MNKQAVGDIAQIMRYPVKSFEGEALQEADVMHYGILGDRGRAVVDPSLQGWDRFFTARQAPELLSYKAELAAPAAGAEGLPDVRITGPDGAEYRWDDALLTAVQRYSDRTLALETYDPKEEHLLGVDAEQVLLLSDASLRALAKQWGKKLDEVRFRPNLVVSLDEDKPLAELDWIGKRVQIGDTVLQVNKRCMRCVMITIDPDNLEKDPSLLKTLKDQEFCFGVYASVVETGLIFVGDPVYVID
ncbi:MOSC domain-containing protein [Paenibacillus gansuensis]|uniref:MOSC domain-containing protein n=1 Tax=Paenibacillus gansuensis TaxID=306542 RepID=A0ABW5PI35_9BACL